MVEEVAWFTTWLTALLVDVMSATTTDANRFELRGERRGGTFQLDPPPAQRGRPGAGTVHHVAWFAPSAEHAAWVDHLRVAGVDCTPVVDRHFFRSIYFREPGGVLFEIATDPPGFAVDEPADKLGTSLVLPRWLEPRRSEVERVLPPLRLPKAHGGEADAAR